MTSTKNNGVKYTFAGQYYTGNKEQSEQVKDYELQVVFPQVYPNALSIFKTSLIKQCDSIYHMMKKKYPNFKTVRTYAVTNIEDLSGKEINTRSIATMNTKQLVKYIENNELGIDAQVYEGNITGLRNVVILAKEEPEKFKEVYAADVQQYEFNKQINELNNVQSTDKTGKPLDDTSKNNGKEKDIDDLLSEANQVGE
ncbi:MAG: hypothetical protein L6V95_09940 [Candidatus Melainabacteria bacterium]|nr:MAG: hypothetical protein L6V95_09940 [Candidatus Melainabacteria bacterium]